MQDDRKVLHKVNSFALKSDLSRSKLYDLMARKKLKYVEIEGDRRIPDSELQRLATEGVPCDATTKKRRVGKKRTEESAAAAK